MADYWIKLYLEILDDSKMAVLPDRLWRRVIELFLMAGRCNQDGALPETRQLAWTLRFPVDDLEMELQQIASTGIIQKTIGGWFIPKFAKRQSPSTDAERKRQQRERDNKKQYYQDDNVTELSRVVTQSRTDTDTEQNRTEAEGDDKFSLLPLSKAFAETSGLPECSGGAQKYYTALQEMKTAGVLPEDLTQAIQELREKNYTIASPRSCVIAAINCMGKRTGKNGRKKEQYTGPNGEVIEL